MSSNLNSVIRPTGLIHGHSECRYLDETIPVLTQVLALDLIERADGQAVLKHPNTGWKLILHEGGAEVKDKPERNHYGVRVSNNEEVDRAYQYLLANKERLGLKKVVKRKERDGSYSMFFVEPGGNYWEIESYENRHKAGLPEHVAYPWKTKLSEERLPGCGYIPQAMTHGTMECTNLASSVKFYKEGLGLDVITHVPTVRPHDIKHPSTPWYVVSLEVPAKNKHYLTPLQRYTVAVESSAALAEAQREMNARREEFGTTSIEPIKEIPGGQSFLLCDLDRNWWEIAYIGN
ncbi:MAG TPA: VOC family protein [Candidatus Binatia bacterium]|nr:VOC family protein [Candidatus Binatia bacterium]